MRLDRNKSPDGTCRYALVDLRKLAQRTAAGKEPIVTIEQLAAALGGYLSHVPGDDSVVSFGRPGTDNEFFALKLKDEYAYGSLIAYAAAAGPKDPEYGCDVVDLAKRALNHPGRKRPD